MTSLKTVLMSSAAAITLAAAPTLAQEATTETDAPEAQLETTGTAPAGRSFDETYGEGFAELGERNVEELLGTTVVNDAGETIGQVDNFGLVEDQIVAIVGIGGFLGIGEHNVALPLDSLTFDGQQLLISGVTREELEAMPQYDEGDAQTFAADQTLRGGYEGTGDQVPPSDTASVQPSDSPAADQPMDDAQEEVAQAEADAETTVEDEMAEGEASEGVGQQAGEDVAEATQQAGTEVEEAREDLTQTAEEAGEAVEDVGSDPAEEVAQATDEAATEVEQTADTAEAEVQEGTGMATSEEAEQPAEGTEMTTAETADQPAEGTEMAADESAQPMTDEAEMAEAEQTGWSEEMETIFADIADRQINELIGMDVASADGDVVGQVDNFALAGEDVVAIVGVGGFLGIGEHDVALSLGEMTYDGERLVISSMTEEQLREMPEYEEAGANYLSGDGTLRSTYQQ